MILPSILNPEPETSNRPATALTKMKTVKDSDFDTGNDVFLDNDREMEDLEPNLASDMPK